MMRTAIVLTAMALALGGCPRTAPPQARASDSTGAALAKASQTSAPPSPAARPIASGRFAPRDDCTREEGAASFRAALAQAIRKRDVSGVVALADPAIKLGFGGEDGIVNLRQQLASPDGKLFAELDKLQTLGCALDERGALVLPWYFAQDMAVEDPYMAMLVTASDAPLHVKADASSPVSEKVGWDAVTLMGSFHPERTFQQVRTRDGKTGYMATDVLRSLLAYRLLAEKRDGAWKITALLAGD